MCLQWSSDSVNDMYADAVLAVVLKSDAHSGPLPSDGKGNIKLFSGWNIYNTVSSQI